MMGLLIFKERIKAFYAKYDFCLNAVLKFVFAVTALLLVDSNIGFLTSLKNPLIAVVLGLICSFLPLGVMPLILAVFVLAQLYGLSLELTVVTAIIMIIAAVLYSGLQPGDSVLMILTPMLFFLKIPYLLPLIVGFSFGLPSVIPMCIGVFLYYLMAYARQNAGVLAGAAGTDIAQKYMQILKGLFTNQMMLLMILAFTAAVIFVVLIKNLSIDYSWTIAIAAGMVVQLAVIFVGDQMLNVTLSVGSVAIGVVVSVILAFLYHFFVFAVDYTRTEFLQFEDDDYYYYVKAVPKVTLSAPDVRVQTINERKDL